MVRHVFTLLLLLLIASSGYAQVLNPGGGVVGGTGTAFPNISVGPGMVSIDGNTNGLQSVINNVNVNGVMNALSFPGVDIGAKVNNAIGALGAHGGRIHIPVGRYTFSTTIQCPLTTNAPVIIEGDGKNGDFPGGSLGTTLTYTGNTDAVNQVITVGAYQNAPGCQLRDLTLDGSTAGSNAVGFHFGGTNYSGAYDVGFIQFAKAGIEIENAPNRTVSDGFFTERYEIRGSNFYHNVKGIYFHCDAGCDNSFGHGYVQAWFNVDPDVAAAGGGNCEAISVDGGGLVYDSTLDIDGNAEGTTAQNAIFMAADQASQIQGWVVAKMECDVGGSLNCQRFWVDNNSVIAVRMDNELGGNWVDTVLHPASGSNIYITALAAGSIIHAASNIYAGFNGAPTPNDTNFGDIWSRRNGHTDQGLYVFGNGSIFLDYGVSYAGAFAFNGGAVVVPAIANQCSGAVSLAGGTATVSNACLTAGRVVICTDATAANPVRCQSSGTGTLTIVGTGVDVIQWARQ